MAKQEIKVGDLVRAHRNNDDLHGFRSGQLVRVTAVYKDGCISAEGPTMGVSYSSGRYDGRPESYNWGTQKQSMWLYPDGYKYAKQANRKES